MILLRLVAASVFTANNNKECFPECRISKTKIFHSAREIRLIRFSSTPVTNFFVAGSAVWRNGRPHKRRNYFFFFSWEL